MKHVLVIGGGAAGLVAALAASRGGARVTVLEAAERVGRKLLATGNGRCNLTNMQVTPSAYNCPAFVEPALATWTPQRVRGFFRELGLLTFEEREGRVYPCSNTATSVLDVLRLGCRCAGVEIVCGFDAVGISERDSIFAVTDAKGNVRRGQAVVVATGGATRLLGACGHELAPFSPVLCSLKTDTDVFRGLSGLRVQAQVSAYEHGDAAEPFARESGEVLFRDYGLSGIVIFDMSRMVGEGMVLSLDLLPDMDAGEVGTWLHGRMEALTGGNDPTAVSYEDLLTGTFHSRVAACVLRAAGCRPSAQAEAGDLGRIARACKDLRTTVHGVGDAKHAQVTRGGARVDAFDAQTLESRQVPGLHAVGETLDVDARCGGYNLHWAWASGLVAGAHAASVCH